MIFTLSESGNADVPGPVQILAVLAILFAARLSSTDNEGLAFTCSAVAIAATVGSLFIELYPDVMISSTSAAYDLTVSNAASGGYALKVMTIVTVLLLPVVLLYQGWSFYVFRGRVTAPAESSTAGEAPEPPPAPLGASPQA